MRLDTGLALSKQTPRPLTWEDAGVVAALALAIALLGVPFTFLAATFIDRVLWHWMDGPHTVAVTRWLLAGTLGLGTAVSVVVRWIWNTRLYDVVVATEEQSTAAPAQPATPVVEWQMPAGPNSITRGRLLCTPELLIEWSRAAASEQSLSYATWGQRFGGTRQYAAFLAVVVHDGLGTQSGGRGELKLTRKGYALFSQIAVMDPIRTPLLDDLPLLQDRTTG